MIKVNGNGFERGVEHWLSITRSGLHRDFLDAAEDVAAEVLDRVYREAATDPDWDAAIDGAYVGRSGKGVGLALPQETYDLEHGNPEKGVPMKPIVRTTINSMGQEIEGLFNKAIGQRLFG